MYNVPACRNHLRQQHREGQKHNRGANLPFGFGAHAYATMLRCTLGKWNLFRRRRARFVQSQAYNPSSWIALNRKERSALADPVRLTSAAKFEGAAPLRHSQG